MNNIKWNSIHGEIKPEIGKQYLVNCLRSSICDDEEEDSDPLIVTMLGKFNGENWTIANDSEQFTYFNDDEDFSLISFAEIPKIKKSDIEEPMPYATYLVSVKLRNKRYRTMIGTFQKDSWLLGDTEDVIEAYSCDIHSIKISSISLY